MIRDTHLQTLRDLVEQQERDLAGYRRLLQLAEQEARVGTVFPDPLTAPWPTPAPAASMPMPSQWNLPVAPPAGPAPWTVDDVPLTRVPAPNGNERRLAPYAADFDGTLPREKEDVLGDFHAEHQADAATSKATKEQQKWEQA